MAFMLPKEDEQNVAIKQHLVPRTYLKKWKHNTSKKTSKVWVYDKKEPGKNFKSTDVREVFFEEYFYDIKIGCNFMPEDALQDLFGCLTEYEIMCNDKKLNSLKEYSDEFFDFDNWIIKDSNGVVATDEDKDKLKILLKNRRHTYIEKAWWQYENNWYRYVNKLEMKIQDIKNNALGISFSYEDIVEIFKYITIYEMRNKNTNGFIDKIIKKMYGKLPAEILECDIEQKDRTHDFLDTIEKQYLHDSKIKGIYEYLKYDSGKYKAGLELYIDKMSVCFWTTTITNPFMTSGNPSMVIINEEGLYEHIFVISPYLLVSLIKTDDVKCFYIKNCTVSDVERFNRKIVMNNDKIISLSLVKNISLLET